MCGIAGFWTPGAADDARSIASAMAGQIHHRGPDGYWVTGHWRPIRRSGTSFQIADRLDQPVGLGRR